MKSVLIFGCNGFVGHYLAKEFKDNNYMVIGSGITEPDTKLLDFVDKYEQLDILDKDRVSEIIKSICPTYIVNLAAISSVGASWHIPVETIEVNVIGSINILEAVKEYSNNSKILLIGSSEEYAVTDSKISENDEINANNPYGISKVTQERFAELYRKEYGLKIINTRTFNHSGVGQSEVFAIPSFVRQVADINNSGKPGVISVGNLGVHRDLGDVRDMVSAYRMILESNTDYTVFNVGSGICYHLEEILDYIVSLSDQVIEIEVDSSKLRPIDNPIIWCDNSLIRRETEWAPKYTIYDAINNMFASMVKSSAEK